MLTSNIKFQNFKISQFNKNNKFKKDKWFNKIRLLDTLKENYKYSYSKDQIKKINKSKNFRLIGMGGSTLGVEAIYQFLNHRIKKKFVFINNLNSKLNNYEKKIKATNIIISKSGNTLETIANSNLLVNNCKNIFITENKKSYLRNLAIDLKSEIIEHKNYIGGRYSVLSEVGMLPAELMGLKSSNFRQLNNLIKNKRFINSLISNVSSTLYFIKQKKFNSVIINYDKKSESLFNWYQQLIAESLGKKKKGLLPIISNMPKDNHSTMQLYLDGFKNNFFTFFYVNEKDSEKINNNVILSSQNYLKNKDLSKIIIAQKKATESIFKKKKIPFRSFEIKRRDEKTLGELFCFFILETILIGQSISLNPYDQPAVELIKTETKKLLIKNT